MQLLENEIIRLRAPEPEDLDMLYIWENDASLWETGNALSPYSRYTLKQYIADADKDIFESKQLRLIIELKASRTAIGNIDLYDFDPHHRRAGVGILIDASHQRRGYAKNALQLIMNYAFTFLKIHQLYAYIPVTNAPSLRLFERCGFENMGAMKDWLLTSDGYADVLLVSYINK